MPRQSLNPEIQQRIIRAVEQNPGSNAGEIAKAVGCWEGTARRHLSRLVTSKQVELRQNPKDCDRFYPIK